MKRIIIEKRHALGGKSTFRYSGYVFRENQRDLIVGAFWPLRAATPFFRVEKGDPCLEYFFFHKWFTVLRIMDKNFQLKGWYCDLSTPARFDGRTLTFTDLALDFFVTPSGDSRVLDRQEFSRLLEERGWENLQKTGHLAGAEIAYLAKSQEFPFNIEEPFLKKLRDYSPDK